MFFSNFGSFFGRALGIFQTLLIAVDTYYKIAMLQKNHALSNTIQFHERTLGVIHLVLAQNFPENIKFFSPWSSHVRERIME